MSTGMVSHELQIHFGLLLKCLEDSLVAILYGTRRPFIGGSEIKCVDHMYKCFC